MSYALSIDDDVMLLAELSCKMCIRDSYRVYPYRVGLYQLVPHARLLGRSGTRLSGGKQGVLSVSYTHLDVYKRQEP